MTEIQIAIAAALVSAFAGIAGVVLQIIFSKRNEKFKKYYDYQQFRFGELKVFKEKLYELGRKKFGDHIEQLNLPNEAFAKSFATETIEKFYKFDELFEQYQFYFDKDNIKELLATRNVLNKLHGKVKFFILESNNGNKVDDNEFQDSYKVAISKSVSYCTEILEYTNSELQRIAEYFKKNSA